MRRWLRGRASVLQALAGVLLLSAGVSWSTGSPGIGLALVGACLLTDYGLAVRGGKRG